MKKIEIIKTLPRRAIPDKFSQIWNVEYLSDIGIEAMTEIEELEDSSDFITAPKCGSLLPGSRSYNTRKVKKYFPFEEYDIYLIKKHE